LEPRQWGPLVRSARVVKETLLGKDAPERAVINIAGGGAKLIGGSTQISVTRDEIRELLVEGFLPRVGLDAKPAARRSGFQEFGLPYAPDAAITRYLAAFLSAHRNAGAREEDEETQDHDPARPDLVLFNGGLFESPMLRERLLEVMASWFGAATDSVTFHVSRFTPWHPEVLKNDRLDLAVARGAAYYGMVRRGHGVRISGGLAHSYFLGVEAGSSDGRSAVCLLPAGVEEGQTVELTDRTFNLLIRQPVEFPLYASSTRTTDRPGDLLAIDPEQMTPLPPIRTVLQSGKKSAAQSVSVRLHAKLTEIGTLDIWCAEAKGDRQWRLQFDVRAATRADAARHEAVGEAEGVLDEQMLAACRQRIAAAFGKGPTGAAERPESLVKKLEEITEIGRHDWPSTLLRGMWEGLMEVEAGRKISEVHEARWLNLAGFCLRPGYGLAADDWRVAQMWKLLPAGVIHPKNELVRAEWWILWRRLAGGLSAGQQRTLAEPLIADWRLWFRKAGSNVFGRTRTFQFGPHESAEVWRMLGSLELLPPAAKLELGGMLLERLPREQTANVREAVLFALGRIGARVPVYGPLNALVAPEAAEDWAKRLMGAGIDGDKAVFAVVQLCRRTGDRYRDVPDETREAAIRFLMEREAAPHYLELVREGGQLRAEEQRVVFGESLPRGLRIE
ncbi:MAG: Chaperone protein DnaK, partial [Phycisphaerales bacterium]|nr:Chaperone protein DnaK [Phycisphaerales bacterium]